MSIRITAGKVENPPDMPDTSCFDVFVQVDRHVKKLIGSMIKNYAAYTRNYVFECTHLGELYFGRRRIETGAYTKADAMKVLKRILARMAATNSEEQEQHPLPLFAEG